jgi:hypothetical protein
MRFLVFVALCALLPANVHAQVPTDRFGGGVTFEIYSFSDADALGIDRISLFTVPLAARAELTRSFSVSVSGAFARGMLTRSDGSSVSLTGPTDTEVRASYVLGNDAIVLTGIALLPTGHEKLDADEAQLAGTIGADVLPFRISNWGTGGGAGGSVAFARTFGEYSTGLSAGYVVAREFEPAADNSAFVYRPGNQLHVTAALDHTTSSAGRLSFRLSFLGYSQDQANGQNLYQSGNRIQGSASYGFAAGPRANGLVYAGALIRGEGEFDVSSQIIPASNLFFGGVGWRLPFAGGVMQPGADLRVMSGSDDADSGYTAGAVMALELPAGTGSVAPSVRVRYGNAGPGNGTKSSYVGAEVALMIRFGSR